ncbi:type II TA system antitoxin MqsA family protein [Halobacteriovorax sp. JY17]|uniref:type II TA system antitoxin MqsA family protein n=1 Tax=Halobacteriovorax sp. JY17 TaxID=2014617 RepID=UPI0025BA03D6|nr:type II TA system antitoxin MqsA family protein [Halobacteriovorax sp. JY17]
MKCPICNSGKIVSQKESFTTPYKASNGDDLVVPNVLVQSCKDCEETWIEAAESKRVGKWIAKERFTPLSREEIKRLRESLPVGTKTELAELLCLNEKAFVKWEKGYNEPNKANDLLLRLIARSRDNFDFVKSLHKKNFKFDASDYFWLQVNEEESDISSADYLSYSYSSVEGTFLSVDSRVQVDSVYDDYSVESSESDFKQPKAA